MLLGVVSVSLAILPFRTTLIFWLSAAAHECGHLIVMRGLGMPVRRVSVRAGGAVLGWETSAVPYSRELAAAAAGPLVNVLLAWRLSSFDAAWLSVNVLLAVYNLLPLRGNDGAVMLLSAAELCGYGDGIRLWLLRLSDIVSALLLMLGAWLFWYGTVWGAGGASIGCGALFFCMLVRLIGSVGGESG